MGRGAGEAEGSNGQGRSAAPLLAVMDRLRDPAGGCEWDLAQDFASIAPYTIEEAYEVADAIARGDHDGLREELGDLLLQVVFHARIAQDRGLFDFGDVVRAISAKMERRHPHIFGTGDAGAADWEALKAEERAADGAESALDGVALALPALMRAEKLQKRAARVGFDWPDPDGAAEKLAEEARELAGAGDEAARIEEAGDLLFAAVNLVRKHGVDPEAALRAANAKFERRFRDMEAHAPAPLAGLDLEAQEALWQAAKARERG